MMNKEKAVVISGATGGIGKALVGAFLSQGRNVIAIGRDFSLLKDYSLVKNFLKIEADLSIDQSFVKIKEKVECFDVDVVINAAGTSYGVGPIDELSEDAWQINLNINLLAVIKLNNLFIGRMKAIRNGCIINVTSMASDKPLAWLAPYCVSKAALKHYTMCLSQELKQYNIRVNSLGVCADTKLYRDHRNQKYEKGFYGSASLPNREMPSPVENIAPFLFLCSDQGANISGQHIECNKSII